MGTESKRSQNGVRGKPPPIPPRPDHLLPSPPTKNGSQYSSMPDILVGRKRDPNPDLLKLKQKYCRNDQKDDYYYYYRRDRSLDRNEQAPPSANNNNNNKFPSKQTELLSMMTMMQMQMQMEEKSNHHKSKQQSIVGIVGSSSSKPPTALTTRNSAGASSLGVKKSFNCIPRRSNSKKKKADGNNSAASSTKHENMGDLKARQTNWYVDNEDNSDGGNNLIVCPSWQAALNYSSSGHIVDFSYPARSKEAAATVDNNCTAAIVRVSSDNKLHCSAAAAANRTMTTASSSSSLSAGLPPLPKSLSDASLSWDYVTKKLATNSQVCGSSSSRSESITSSNNNCYSAANHPKVPPPPPPPPSSSLSSRNESTLSQPQSLSSCLPSVTAEQNVCDANRENVAAISDLSASLDSKLAILRKEMCELRQMDLSLLNQLWSLNEAIHDFRQLQEALSLEETPSSEEDYDGRCLDDEDIERIYSNVNAIVVGSGRSAAGLNNNHPHRPHHQHQHRHRNGGNNKIALSHQNSLNESTTSSSQRTRTRPLQNLYTDL